MPWTQQTKKCISDFNQFKQARRDFEARNDISKYICDFNLINKNIDAHRCIAIIDDT